MLDRTGKKRYIEDMDSIPTDIALPEVAHLLINGHFRFRLPEEAIALAEFLGKTCPNPRLSIVAINEILFNAIEHGNLGISAKEKHLLQKENQWIAEIERRLKLPEHLNQYVHLKVTKTDTEMRLHVKDDGKGFNWRAHKHSDTHNHSTQGRGILMAENLVFKSLEYSEKGNEVTCVIALA